MTANSLTLILSKSQDEHVRRLVAELDKLGHSWVLFDPGDFPVQAELTARLGGGKSESMIVAKNVVFSDATFMELPESLHSKQQFDERSHPGIFAPVPGPVDVH